MRISVLKLDGTSFGRYYSPRKHVRRNFCLSYDNEKLLDDNIPVQHFGIHNHSQVDFVPYIAPKDSRKHSKRRHRFFHGLSKLS
ncbi:hypothetical protein ACFX1Q_016876 [Malus domestica]